MFSFCFHLNRSFPRRDPETGIDTERCLDCGKTFEAKIQFGDWRPEQLSHWALRMLRDWGGPA